MMALSLSRRILRGLCSVDQARNRFLRIYAEGKGPGDIQHFLKLGRRLTQQV